MFLRVRNPLLSRLLVLPWLVTWVLTIPLFHIHALDAQENSFRSQAVLLHTVFSPDLPVNTLLEPSLIRVGWQKINRRCRAISRSTLSLLSVFLAKMILSGRTGFNLFSLPISSH